MMTYKETLFFIGKCLTITHEEQNRIIIENELKTSSIDWDKVVLLSTEHYVFPALYCNLKRVNFLHYLPTELIEYMKHITDLNRERNKLIIKQANEINGLLLANSITPIFIKGTGNLLEGLYVDIAERMVGDIDFLVSEKEYHRTINILKNNMYSKVKKTAFDFPSFNHYPRLQNEENITSIEIHKELLIEKFAKEFNYSTLNSGFFSLNGISFLSYKDQLSLSIMSFQINDYGHHFNTIALRNAYDVFLLSQKTNSLFAIENYRLLFNPLNHFLAICSLTLNSKTLKFKNTRSSKIAINKFNRILIDAHYRKKQHQNTSKYIFLKTRLSIAIKSFYDKETRIWLFKRFIYGKQN